MYRKKNRSCLVTLVMFLMAFTKCISQTRDTTFLSTSIKYAIAFYQQQIGRGSGIYHGVEYEYYPYPFQEGTPYFESRDSLAGAICYEGIWYQNMIMKYDQLKDQVIIWYNNDAVRLIDEKVDSFILRDHLFVRLVNGNSKKDVPASGYYEIIYNGKIKVYEKVIKQILVKTDMTEGAIRIIDQKTNYYVGKSGQYHSIEKENDWYEHFKDHKEEIKEYINRNNLNFKKDRANWLVQVAAYCDKL